MTPIEQVVEGANAVATINLNFKANRGAFVGAFNQFTSIDLTFGVYGGDWNGINVAADTLTLTDDDTNYIVMAVADGEFSVDTGTYDWNDDTNFKRICSIVAAGGLFVENQIQDWRYSPGGLFYGAGGGGGGGSVDSVVAGTNVTVDSTDPANPIVNVANPIHSIILASSDETTGITTGTAKVKFRMPYPFTVTEVRASLTTAQGSGSIFTVDINESGSTILSTKLTIDNTEKTSTTAATPAVVSDASLADDAEISIDVDQVGDGTATGLKVMIIGRKT